MRNKITNLFLFLSLTISCDDHEITLKKEKLSKIEFTSLDNELKLRQALEKVGFFTHSSNSGRLMSGISAIKTDSILKVIQADSINYSYTISLYNETKSGVFKNLVFSRLSNGFLGYVLEYKSNKEPTDYSSFTGLVKKYDLEGNYLSEVSIDKANFSNSSGRTKACFADVTVECVDGGGISTATGLPLPCLQWVTVITIDCMGDSGGSGGATGGWHTLGTYIPDPYGGPGSGGSGSGGGSTTPPEGDPDIEGSVGVLPPTMSNKDALNMVLEEDPFFLVEIPCDQLPNWQYVSSHKVPQSVLDKLSYLSQDQNYWAGLIPYNGWRVQDINDAKGTVVNMDYYSVTINQLPGGETAPQLLEYIRKNINSFIDQTKADFEPFNYSEYELWQSSNPLGSIIHIDMGNDNTWLGGFNPITQPDDGSVICSKAQSDHWIFTTITAPGDGEHPVSGNRQFGFIQHRNGTFTFFTRGVDRLTGTFDQWYSNVQSWRQKKDLGGKTPFDAADELWSSLQDKIQLYVNSNGGQATKNNVEKWQPNWSKVDDYLNGTVSITTFGCK
ncbi:MAG TPA: hypothetical protein PLG85_10100 [Cyclobacteriaceae bacterium]|nr:hypothetical protein [Cyclobacteriaceae bacterium]